MLPEKSLPPDFPRFHGITEDEAQEVFSEVRRQYPWQVELTGRGRSQGLEAQAAAASNVVQLHRGILKQKGMNPDVLALLICHEIGHGLGGPPFKKVEGVPSLRSVEGQADFFAARVCMEKIMPQEKWGLSSRRKILAIQGFIRLLGLYPAMAEYPAPSCRLQTLLAGMDPPKVRPACWFRPSSLKARADNSPLMVAIAQDDLPLRHDLLSGPLDLKKQNTEGHSALILAVLFGRVQWMKELLSHGGGQPQVISIRNHRGKTALLEAVERGWPAMVEQLAAKVEDREKREAYFLSLELGRFAIGRWLLDHHHVSENLKKEGEQWFTRRFGRPASFYLGF